MAESNQDDVLIIQHAFRDAGIINPLVVLKDSEQALEYLNGGGKYADRELFPLPLLLLINRHLGVKDGLQVLEWVANHPNVRKKITVVMLCDIEDPPARARAYALGAEAFVLKPFDYKDTVRMVAGWKRYLQS